MQTRPTRPRASCNTGAELPSLATVGGDDASATATESIAVSGQQGQINGLAGFSEDDLRNRIQDMQRQGMTNGDIAGAFQGAMPARDSAVPAAALADRVAGSAVLAAVARRRWPAVAVGPAAVVAVAAAVAAVVAAVELAAAFGGFRGQNPNAWHGTVAYTGADSALNADSFSVTGRPLPKPQSDRNTLIASFTGIPSSRTSRRRIRSSSSFSACRRRATLRRRSCRPLCRRWRSGYGDLTGAGTVYDPTTGKPYTASNCSSQLLAVNASPTACIPANELIGANSLAGQALLNYYPAPNITPLGTQDNYQANINGDLAFVADLRALQPQLRRSAGARTKSRRSEAATPQRAANPAPVHRGELRLLAFGERQRQLLAHAGRLFGQQWVQLHQFLYGRLWPDQQHGIAGLEPLAQHRHQLLHQRNAEPGGRGRNSGGQFDHRTAIRSTTACPRSA